MSYVNPIGKGLTQGRTDQGVDYTGSGPLYAIGAGTVVNTHNSGWPGLGTFIAIKLDSFAGLPSQYIYYAEDIAPAVKVGDKVTAGQVIGHATGGSTGIEVGWAAPGGAGNTLAAAQGNTGGAGHSNSPMGQNFLAFVHSLGAGGQGATTSSALIPGTGGGGIGDIIGWLTGIPTQFKDLFTIGHNLISPSFWLRVGAFFIGVVLLIGGIWALVKADSSSGGEAYAGVD